MSPPLNSDLSHRLSLIPATPGLRLVSVRHHSPACAQHLQTLIRRDKPDAILIEGPADATDLLAFLGEADAKPPLAFYCYVVPRQSESVSPVPRYRSFYPMAAFSPEWVAIREGLKLGAEVRFIDLPYPEQLTLDEDRPAEKSDQETSLLDERALTRADPCQRLVELSGCRDFNEWWDRYFESGAMSLEPEDYFRNLLVWCLMLRDIRDEREDKTIQQREQFMAQQIQRAMVPGKRCLVVTGGYHTEAIAQFLDKDASIPPPLPWPDERGVYLIPYTLHRLDSANDYAAGIPHSGYYQEVWQQCAKTGREAHRAAAQTVALRVGRALQDRGETVSLPDCIEAVALAQRLAQLRGTRLGRPEILDAIVSAMLKDSHGRADLNRLTQYLSTDVVGRVPKAYPAAPLIEDFRQQCQRYKLPLSPLSKREKRLDIYRSEQHREISRLLHQIHYLNVPYASLSAGPDFAAGTDLSRVREIWQVHWSPGTEAMLTERMAYGSQLAEAVLNLLHERLQQEPRSAPKSLIEALRMGLHGALGHVMDAIEVWLNQESEFPALVRGLTRLHLAYSAQNALVARHLPSLETLLQACFECSCLRLNWLGQMDEDSALACMNALSDLNSLARAESGWADVSLFIQCVEALIRPALPAQLQGQAVAILSVRKVWNQHKTTQALQHALQEAQLNPDFLGDYLLGFLPIGRNLFIQSPELIEAAGQVIEQWDEEIFLSALPGLRLAFTRLKPREIAALADVIRVVLGGATLDVRSELVWSLDDLAALRELHAQAQQALARWGFLHD